MNRRTFFARAAVAPLVAIKPVEPGAKVLSPDEFNRIHEELIDVIRTAALDEEGADRAESIRQRKAEIAEMQRRGMLP